MKKVLIITYYWPPAGGPGVQRWLKFVKYLPEFGIEPIVFVPENPAYPLVDEKLSQQVPSNLQVLKRRIWEPYHIASVFGGSKVVKMSSGIIPSEKKQGFFEKLVLWVRGNLFIPDARKFWVGPSVRYLERYLSENKIDTIITTGPPHSLHLIGLRLKEKIDIRWVADFRDPWTGIGYHSKLRLSKYAEAKHRTLERQVLNSADEILVTSPSTANDFQKITPKTVHVITNGFDIAINAENPRSEKFTISHVGSLLSGRNPKSLWQALSELVAENPSFKESLELTFAGAISSEIVDTLKRCGLDKVVRINGYLEHEKAIELQRSAQVLLLIEIDSEQTKCIIPGKLFEYMASGRPVIAIGPEGSDIEDIIKETRIGAYFNYRQKDQIKALISAHFDRFKSGELRAHGEGVEKYTRRNLTERLAEILQQ